jgi:hypothetical protein
MFTSIVTSITGIISMMRMVPTQKCDNPLRTWVYNNLLFNSLLLLNLNSPTLYTNKFRRCMVVCLTVEIFYWNIVGIVRVWGARECVREQIEVIVAVSASLTMSVIFLFVSVWISTGVLNENYTNILPYIFQQITNPPVLDIYKYVVSEGFSGLVKQGQEDQEEDSLLGRVSVDALDAICAICQEDYVLGEKIKVLPCNHHLHSSCIDTWFEIRVTCPLCIASAENNVL